MKLSSGNIFNDLRRWQKMYLKHIKSQGFSKNSISLYNYSINTFIDFLYEEIEDYGITDISELNSIIFTSFLSFLENVSKKNKKVKNIEGTYLMSTSKASYLKSLRSFFSFISMNNNEDVSFMKYFSSIRVGKTSEAKREFLDEYEIKRLISYLDAHKNKNSFNSYRNSLLIKVMLFGGLRISEGLGLKLCDFFLIESSNMFKITVYGKGGYRQDAYIERDVVSDEIDFFNEVGYKNDLPLMVSGKGNVLDRTNVYTMVNLIYKKCLISKKGLHTLRHSVAMRLMRNGVDISTTQKFLRQKSITSTQIYAKAEEKDIAKALSLLSSSSS